MCHAYDPDDASEELVLTAYCEACWVREFGETKAEHKQAD